MISPSITKLELFVLGPHDATTIPSSQQCHNRYAVGKYTVYTPVPLNEAVAQEFVGLLGDTTLLKTPLSNYFRTWMIAQGCFIFRNIGKEAIILAERAATAKRHRELELTERAAAKAAFETECADITTPMLHAPKGAKFSASLRKSKAMNNILYQAWHQTVNETPVPEVRKYVITKMIEATNSHRYLINEYDYEDFYDEIVQFWGHFPPGWRHAFASRTGSRSLLLASGQITNDFYLDSDPVC